MIKQLSHFLQSHYWKEIKEDMGQNTVEINNHILYIKQVRFKNTIGYIPRVTVDEAISKNAMKKYYELGVTYVRIDPLDQSQNLNFNSLPETRYPKLATGIPIQLPRTVIIDLSKSNEELINQMKQKHRYNLRLADKKEITIAIDSSEISFQIFLTLYLQTVQRQGYVGRGEDYIKTVWNIAKKYDQVQIATAYYKKQPIASWMLLTYKDTIYYPYGGTSDFHRNVMGTYKMVWEIIQWAKKRGYKLFDLYGIEGDGSDGFSRFKLGFVEKDQSQIVEYPQTIDIVFKPMQYKLLRVVENVRNQFSFLKRI